MLTLDYVVVYTDGTIRETDEEGIAQSLLDCPEEKQILSCYTRVNGFYISNEL